MTSVVFIIRSDQFLLQGAYIKAHFFIAFCLVSVSSLEYDVVFLGAMSVYHAFLGVLFLRIR